MVDKLFIAFFLICCSIHLGIAEIQSQNGKIKMTIGTTSGCGHTVMFIADLVPIYEEYKQYLDIEFVPWGRTKIVDGDLVCQFGDRDCWANRLHRCVLDILKGNQDAQVKYMACEFTTPRPAFELGTYSCALEAELSLYEVDYCMSTSGDALGTSAQEASVRPMEIINFVPFIVFNDVIDQSNHGEARTRLRSLICFALADDPSTNVTHCTI